MNWVDFMCGFLVGIAIGVIIATMIIWLGVKRK